EVPGPKHGFVENLIQHEMRRFAGLDDGKRAYFQSRQARRTERRRQEWDLADVVIVNSRFTRNTYAAVGLDVAKVRVIPLGAPQVHADGAQGGGGESEPLRALWA